MTQQQGISNILITKISKKKSFLVEDAVAIEEPLEIKLAYFKGNEVVQKSLSITMRTPGNDIDLALGFLLSEGIIRSEKDVVKAQYLKHKSLATQENKLLIGLAKNVDFDFKKLERHFYTSSSCGVCGKSSINGIKKQKYPTTG